MFERVRHSNGGISQEHSTLDYKFFHVISNYFDFLAIQAFILSRTILITHINILPDHKTVVPKLKALFSTIGFNWMIIVTMTIIGKLLCTELMVCQ